jgi:hypothetical protein
VETGAPELETHHSVIETGLRHAPGTEIFQAETGRRKPAHHLTETDQRHAESEKARFPHTNYEIACEGPNPKTGWWRQ